MAVDPIIRMWESPYMDIGTRQSRRHLPNRLAVIAHLPSTVFSRTRSIFKTGPLSNAKTCDACL